MRTRQGFVSNSSTSSFVILGYALKKADSDDSFRAKVHGMREKLRAKEEAEIRAAIMGGNEPSRDPGLTVMEVPDRSYDAYLGVGGSWDVDAGGDEPLFLDDVGVLRDKMKVALAEHGLWSDEVARTFGLHTGSYAS